MKIRHVTHSKTVAHSKNKKKVKHAAGRYIVLPLWYGLRIPESIGGFGTPRSALDADMQYHLDFQNGIHVTVTNIVEHGPETSWYTGVYPYTGHRWFTVYSEHNGNSSFSHYRVELKAFCDNGTRATRNELDGSYYCLIGTRL
jgi:hypothetical protein